MDRKITSRIAALAAFAASLLVAPTAQADSDSLFTLGLGAQYSFVSPDVAADQRVAGHQYGIVGRAKLLRFLGVEGVAQLDQDPKTQHLRLLSPRYQVGAMVNLIPTSHFNLFVVGGLGAHTAGDLFTLDGRTTSFHAGPGLEFFIGDHLALGGDVRFRAPGPAFVKDQVREELSREPIDDALNLSVWQANLTLTWYL